MRRILNIKDVEGDVIYHLYDRHKNIIYVGSTNNIVRRIEEHVSQQSWGHEIVYYDLVKVRDGRFDTEAFHIAQLKPKYNMMFNGYKNVGCSAPSKQRKKKDKVKIVYVSPSAGVPDNRITKHVNGWKAKAKKMDGSPTHMIFQTYAEAERWLKHVDKNVPVVY